MVVLHLLLFINPPRPGRLPAEHWIPTTPQLGWQGPFTAPALANPFYICIHIPFPPLLRGFTQREEILEMAILWL